MNRFWMVMTVALAMGCSDDTARTASNNGIRVQMDAGITPDAHNSGDLGGEDAGADVEIPVVESCQPGLSAGCATEDALFVCKADGSGLELVSCGEQNCLNGACSDMACVPNTVACEGGEAFKQCNADGTGCSARPVPQGTVCNGISCKPICELGKYESSHRL
ncbi:MAG: hypothetical protein R3E66_15495 [bacterium]